MAANFDTEKKYAKAQRAATKRAKARTTAGRVASKQAQAESAIARKRAMAPAAPVKKAAVKKAAPKKAAPAKKYAAPAESGTTFRSTFGSKMEGPVSQRIRGAEWAYRKAGHAANLRKKARAKAGVTARKTIASDKKAGAKVGKYSAK